MEATKKTFADIPPYNAQATQRLASDPKQKAYVQWALENGVIMDKIEFPAVFGGGLVGSRAKEDIGHNEAFVYIPSKILLTVERARSHPEIGHIFNNHDSIFKANEDRDFLTLLLMVMYEHQKSDQSFWHPYFQAVDPGTLTCFWDQKILDGIDDAELKATIQGMRDNYEEDWNMISKLLKIYSPQHFDLKVCTFDLYKHCCALIATRCFGWGLPSTIVAPIADSFNHHSKANTMVDIVNKRLHLMQNKIYAYQYDFEADPEAGDEPYDKEVSKLKYNVKRLFKEDADVLANQEYSKLVEGEKEASPHIEPDKRYNPDEVFQRFKNLMRSEVDNTDEYETEEMKKERFPNHGLELWGIGYITSDHSEDEDEEDTEEQEDCAYNEDLRRKILSQAQGGNVDFEMEEFENISSNTRLREIYQFRWWSDSDKDSYFIMMNRSGKPIKAGQQIYYNYGKRNNAYLLQNYGFVMDESNQYNTLHFRVVLGTNPKQAINHVSELFPTQKTLDDRETIETTTEKVKLAAYRLSDSFFNYLRSVLQSNYTGPDQEYLMISSPRLIEYELMIVEWAIDMLLYYEKEELYKRTTLEEDCARAQAVVNYQHRVVLEYNIERKRVHERHKKMLKVLKVTLERIATEKQTFSRACFTRVPGVEEFDSDEEVFRRRMGMRRYFKELRMNMQRIERSKEQKAQGRSEDKKASKAKKAKKEGEAGEGQVGESPKEKEKKPKTQKSGSSTSKKGSSSQVVAKKKVAVKK